jgi:cyclophilin family peptidyl-prolyl cis-trans isomerase
MQSLAVLKDKHAVPLLEAILRDTNYSVAVEAFHTLQKIIGDGYVERPVVRRAPVHTEADWALLDWVRENRVVAISTSRGVVTFELLPEEAPFTCMSFTSLIRKGYFDGLTFHRVVPNFVIQGGDPRGDGWGGPGYTIRSEFGYEHYERGVVGMASSGKDTEGSQFFVTHSNQPHLDGRYTIFGRVISGIDVVDLIQAGDTIRTMTLTESAGQQRDN